MNSSNKHTVIMDPNNKPEGIPANPEAESAYLEVEAISKMKKDNPRLIDVFKHFDVTTIQLSSNVETDDDNVVGDLNDNLSEFDNHFYSVTDSEIRRKLGDYLAMNGFVDAAVTKYLKILKDAEVFFLTDDILKDFTTCDSLRGVLWNYSDSSIKFGERVAKTGFFHNLIEDLKVLQKKSDQDVKDSIIFDSAIGILHNCSNSTSAETRECFRREDTVQVLVPFLKNQFTKVKILILLTLSNIINEEENDLLTADDSVFDVIIEMITKAMKTHDHRYDGFSGGELVADSHDYDGFSVVELLAGLKGLARNDPNKEILIKKGCLPLLINIIEAEHENEEVLQAIETVRVLSFSKEKKNEIKDNEPLMKILKDLSDKEAIQKAAAGVLWNVKDNKENKSSPLKAKGHVMISYQWADQKKLIQIENSLSQAGYLIWMDINDMGGSTLQAMADAVENASVVLMCISEQYKDSSNCRTEAEYAFKLDKPIIPLMMQRDYDPTGWLGAILGTILYVEFNGKYSYDDSLKQLIEQLVLLGNKGRHSSENNDTVDGPIAGMKSAPLRWTPDDVLQWLKRMKLEKNKKLLRITGEQLFFLKKMLNRAPESFFSYVQTNLGLKDLEGLTRFTNAIDQLP